MDLLPVGPGQRVLDADADIISVCRIRQAVADLGEDHRIVRVQSQNGTGFQRSLCVKSEALRAYVNDFYLELLTSCTARLSQRLGHSDRVRLDARLISSLWMHLYYVVKP